MIVLSLLDRAGQCGTTHNRQHVQINTSNYDDDDDGHNDQNDGEDESENTNKHGEHTLSKITTTTTTPTMAMTKSNTRTRTGMTSKTATTTTNTMTTCGVNGQLVDPCGRRGASGDDSGGVIPGISINLTILPGGPHCVRTRGRQGDAGAGAAEGAPPPRLHYPTSCHKFGST